MRRFIAVNRPVILFSHYCCICTYIHVHALGIFFFFLLLNDYLFLRLKIDSTNNFKINAFKSLDLVNEVIIYNYYERFCMQFETLKTDINFISQHYFYEFDLLHNYIKILLAKL